VKHAVKSLVGAFGYSLAHTGSSLTAGDLEPRFQELYARCAPFTMTSLERMYALFQSIEYVVRRGIPGDIVECGVWKGGSAMLAALALQSLDSADRRIHLYDTYAGMTMPSEADVDLREVSAQARWQNEQRDGFNQWCYASLDEVRTNVFSTGYPPDLVQFVEGRVEDTIPAVCPEQIAVLRLDTDWYESTHHELVHLFPLIATNGVLIIDDYGYWRGQREAVDEYFRSRKTVPLLQRIDVCGRLMLKTG
jgi:O-methyltransferase